MLEIRRYIPEYRDRLREIVIETASNPAMDETQRLLHYYMYNDYYTQFEPDNIFVAYDTDLNLPVGYIMGSSDLDLYEEKMRDVFLPRIRELSESKAEQQQEEIAVFRRAEKEYPAHLHIDIVSGYQGSGLGGHLMNAFLEHLQQKHVPGVMLGVSKTRPHAFRFYRKAGFEILGEDESGCMMGKKLL